MLNKRTQSILIYFFILTWDHEKHLAKSGNWKWKGLLLAEHNACSEDEGSLPNTDQALNCPSVFFKRFDRFCYLLRVPVAAILTHLCPLLLFYPGFWLSSFHPPPSLLSNKPKILMCFMISSRLNGTNSAPVYILLKKTIRQLFLVTIWNPKVTFASEESYN